jgi:hypothetical protein
VQKTLLNVEFRRKSTELLSLSELSKFRKSSEVEVSKGKVPLFGRRTDENLFGKSHGLL